MTLRDPILGTVYESGADDRVYDGLLLLGPVVILLIAVLVTVFDERPLIVELLAAGYVAVFVGYVLYRGVDCLLFEA